MPLFGFRKDKKHEQGHIQAQAELAKAAASKGRRQAKVGRPTGAKRPKVSPMVVTKDAGSVKAGPAAPKSGFVGAAGAIISPHVTEKSGIMSQSGVYTFEIAAGANKVAVAEAVKALYKVTPTRISIVNLPGKRVFVRGKRGRVSGVRKAMVALKAGEKIDFI